MVRYPDTSKAYTEKKTTRYRIRIQNKTDSIKKLDMFGKRQTYRDLKVNIRYDFTKQEELVNICHL